MNWKLFLMEKVTKWLLGGKLFDQIKALVTLYASEDMPPEKKRKKVNEKIKAIFGGVADFLVNLGIEVAVLLLKAQTGELQKVEQQIKQK